MIVGGPAGATSLGDETGEEDDTMGGIAVRHCDQCPFDGDYSQLKGFSKFRADVHFTMENPNFSVLAKVISLGIIALICVSTVAFSLETVPEISHLELWYWLELITVALFSLEYFLRLFSSRSAFWFIFNTMNFIDLLAVLPFYVEEAMKGDSAAAISAFQVFRVIRLARVFRVFKLSRYSTYMRIMTLALKQSSDAFSLLLFFIGIAVIIFSSLMYYAEKDVPRMDACGAMAPSPFTSIPATFYWSIVTMTTVGYGDVVPVTTLGKIIASATMLCGILIIALPITILGSNFQDVYAVQKKLKLAHKNNSATMVELKEHVEAIRRHRVKLDNVLKQLRFLMQSRAKDTDFFQIWTSVDYVVINGLLRVEQFLTRLEVMAPVNGGNGYKSTSPTKKRGAWNAAHAAHAAAFMKADEKTDTESEQR